MTTPFDPRLDHDVSCDDELCMVIMYADLEAKAMSEADGHRFNCKCEVCAPFADSDAPLGGMFDD